MNRTQPDFFSRSMQLDIGLLNPETRTLPVSFSSELPVPRRIGGETWNEVLLHGPENVNLDRLRSAGSTLYDHQSGIIIGPLNNVRLDGKRGFAEIGFDDDDDGNKYMRKVQGGSLRGVSPRYTIQEYRLVRNGEDWNGIKGPSFVATLWTPYEISLTPIPADATVGIGRSMAETIENFQRKIQGDSDMDKDEILKLIKDTVGEAGKRAVADAVPEIVAQVRAVLAEEAKPKMLISIDEARDLTGRAGALGLEAKSEITNMIFEGRSLAECQTKLVDIATANPDARNTGSSSRDGSGLPAKTGKEAPGQRNVTFETVDDDALFRSLANPSRFPIQ